MSAKEYCEPDLEIIVIQQEDIATTGDSGTTDSDLEDGWTKFY